jgi:putative transposase
MTRSYFVSESSVYRMLKAQDLITTGHIVIKAADEFKDKTTRPNELWQTDFTYLKVIGWGWFYLSTILDDYSRYIIAWKLCTTMKAGTSPTRWNWPCRHQAATARPCRQDHASCDNGPCYIAGELAEWLDGQGMEHTRGAPYHPQTQGKIERWHQT